MTPKDFLKEGSEYVPNWSSFATGSSITYEAGEQPNPKEWSMTVKFGTDKEAASIATALSKIPGYTSVQSTSTTLTVLLMKGTVAGGTTTQTP